MRPHCSAFVGASLDGFIARKDGGLDWLRPFEGEDSGFDAFLTTVDALVMGRGTYDTVLGFGAWPYGERPVFVLTHRPTEPRYRERFMQGSPAEVLDALAAEGASRVYVDGGKVISAFIDAGLLDALVVSIVPRLLGQGLPLFTLGEKLRALKLRGHRALGNGLVQLRYDLER